MKKFVITFVLSLSFLSVSLAQAPNLTLTSPAFKDTQDIPTKYTCNGDNINPPLQIQNVPKGTKSLILYVHDPDAKAGDWSHWMVYNIPPTTKKIRAYSIPGYEVVNNFNQFHYSGPCPPAEESHHYIFDLFAINTSYTLNENGSAYGLLHKIEGHILSKTRLVGTYKTLSLKQDNN